MIVAERKTFDQIWDSVKNLKSVLVLGCGTCVSVCQAGGEKEVGLLASELRMMLDGAAAFLRGISGAQGKEIAKY